jgi:hypothetical protein
VRMSIPMWKWLGRKSPNPALNSTGEFIGRAQFALQVKNCAVQKWNENKARYRMYLCIFKTTEEKIENPSRFLQDVNECLLTLYKVTA